VVRRLSRIANAARPPSVAVESEPDPIFAPEPVAEPVKVSGARAVAAAAQAFSERRRSGGLAA
jgi:hypothetical protein